MVKKFRKEGVFLMICSWCFQEIEELYWGTTVCNGECYRKLMISRGGFEK